MVREIDKFVGIRYRAVRFENLDELYEMLGELQRHICLKAQMLKLRMNFSELKDGCRNRKYYSTSVVCLKKGFFGVDAYTFVDWNRVSFTPGKYYWEPWLGNGLCKTIVNFDGNKMIQSQRGTREIDTVREFFEDQLITTITIDGVQAKIYHEQTDDCCC